MSKPDPTPTIVLASFALLFGFAGLHLWCGVSLSPTVLHTYGSMLLMQSFIYITSLWWA